MTIFKTYTISLESQQWIVTNIHAGEFAIMDIVENYIDGSNWRSSKSLKNILEYTYYSINDIEEIIYNREDDTTFLLFKNEYHFNDCNFKAIKFSKTFEKITIDLYNNYNCVMSFSSNLEISVSPISIYKALCLLSRVKKKYAIITLAGSIYQSNSIGNYYPSAKGNLELIEDCLTFK